MGLIGNGTENDANVNIEPGSERDNLNGSVENTAAHEVINPVDQETEINGVTRSTDSNIGGENKRYIAFGLVPLALVLGIVAFLVDKRNQRKAAGAFLVFDLFDGEPECVGTGDPPDSYHDGHYHFTFTGTRYLSTHCECCIETKKFGFFTAPDLSIINEGSREYQSSTAYSPSALGSSKNGCSPRKNLAILDNYVLSDSTYSFSTPGTSLSVPDRLPETIISAPRTSLSILDQEMHYLTFLSGGETDLERGEAECSYLDSYAGSPPITPRCKSPNTSSPSDSSPISPRYLNAFNFYSSPVPMVGEKRIRRSTSMNHSSLESSPFDEPPDIRANSSEQTN